MRSSKAAPAAPTTTTTMARGRAPAPRIWRLPLWLGPLGRPLSGANPGANDTPAAGPTASGARLLVFANARPPARQAFRAGAPAARGPAGRASEKSWLACVLLVCQQLPGGPRARPRVYEATPTVWWARLGTAAGGPAGARAPHAGRARPSEPLANKSLQLLWAGRAEPPEAWPSSAQRDALADLRAVQS